MSTTVPADSAGTLRLEIRYFAAARAAAGQASEIVELSDAATVGDLETLLGESNPDLATVLSRCSYLRDSVAVRDRGRRLAPCSVIDVLPPFAGG